MKNASSKSKLKSNPLSFIVRICFHPNFCSAQGFHICCIPVNQESVRLFIRKLACNFISLYEAAYFNIGQIASPCGIKPVYKGGAFLGIYFCSCIIPAAACSAARILQGARKNPDNCKKCRKRKQCLIALPFYASAFIL